MNFWNAFFNGLISAKEKDIPDPGYDKNCAVRERTGDGISVGRCWFHVDKSYSCPRHGNVLHVQKRFTETGELTDELDLPQNQ
jgi:hypothetical protein